MREGRWVGSQGGRKNRGEDIRNNISNEESNTSDIMQLNPYHHSVEDEGFDLCESPGIFLVVKITGKIMMKVTVKAFYKI